MRAERRAAIIIHMAFVRNGKIRSIRRSIYRPPSSISGYSIISLILLNRENKIAAE
jgi:hypothetical protein